MFSCVKHLEGKKHMFEKSAKQAVPLRLILADNPLPSKRKTWAQKMDLKQNLDKSV